MNRLKIKEVPFYRGFLAQGQGNRCGLCGVPLEGRVANLDHDHKTGLIRSVLCRQCNTLLGKIENYLNTYGHDHPHDFLSNVEDYINWHKANPGNVYHPSYRTPEEKKERRNNLARLARVKRKAKK